MGELFPFLLSAVTIVAMWLAGSNWRYTWLLSTGNQFLWLGWIIMTRTWGFLPMNIAMFVVSIRNHLRWKARSKEHERKAENFH